MVIYLGGIYVDQPETKINYTAVIMPCFLVFFFSHDMSQRDIGNNNSTRSDSKLHFLNYFLIVDVAIVAFRIREKHLW